MNYLASTEDGTTAVLFFDDHPESLALVGAVILDWEADEVISHEMAESMLRRLDRMGV